MDFESIVTSAPPGTTPDAFFKQAAQTARAIEQPAPTQQTPAPATEQATIPTPQAPKIEAAYTPSEDWQSEADAKRKALIDGSTTQTQAQAQTQPDWNTQPKTSKEWAAFKQAREAERNELMAQIEAAKKMAQMPEDYELVKKELEEIKPRWQQAEDYFSKRSLKNSYTFQQKYAKIDEVGGRLKEEMKAVGVPQEKIDEVLKGNERAVANFLDRHIDSPTMRLKWSAALFERLEMRKQRDSELAEHKAKVAEYAKQDQIAQAQQQQLRKQQYVAQVKPVMEMLAKGVDSITDPAGKVIQHGLPPDIILQNPDFRQRVEDTVTQIFAGDAKLTEADIVAAFTSHITKSAVLSAYQAQQAELEELRSKLARITGMQPNVQATGSTTAQPSQSVNGWHDDIFKMMQR